MTTMSISLPDGLRDYVESQVGQRYGSVSEYMRELIRRDQDLTEFRARILAGGESPVTGTMDQHYFEALRSRITQPVA